MAKLRGAALGALGGIIATAVFAGTAVVGCGDDSGGTPTDGGGADQTSSSSSGGSSSSSGSGSSSSSSGGSSGSSSSSGGSGGGDAGDARAPDADAAVTLDADAGTSLEAAADADAGPACTTTTIATADGGSVNVGEGGTGQLFFSFDDGVVPPGWAADPGSSDAGVVGSTLTVNTSEGHTCPGALQLTIPFNASNQQVDLKFSTNGPMYTGTQFHFWRKVEVPTPSEGGAPLPLFQEVAYGQTYAQWHAPDAAAYTQNDFISAFPQTGWEEIVVPLSGCSGCAADSGVVSFGLDQLGTNLISATQDAAPLQSVVILLDDIWLE